MIPIPVEEYFDDYEICFQCRCFVYYPYYLYETIAVCRACFDDYRLCTQCRSIVCVETICLDRMPVVCQECESRLEEYETEEENGWTYCNDVNSETDVCY